MTTPWESRYAVYRAFDAHGHCLYVGCTNNLDNRMVAHRLNSPWGQDVARVKVTLHSDKWTARGVEEDEIRRLGAQWNIYGRGPRIDWSLKDYVETLVAMEARGSDVINDRSAAIRRGLLAQFKLRFPDVAALVLPTIDLGVAA